LPVQTTSRNLNTSLFPSFSSQASVSAKNLLKAQILAWDFFVDSDKFWQGATSLRAERRFFNETILRKPATGCFTWLIYKFGIGSLNCSRYVVAFVDERVAFLINRSL